jgi:hypothetical protein
MLGHCLDKWKKNKTVDIDQMKVYMKRSNTAVKKEENTSFLCATIFTISILNDIVYKFKFTCLHI